MITVLADDHPKIIVLEFNTAALITEKEDWRIKPFSFELQQLTSCIE